MKRMTFDEIYRDHPEIYRSFHTVVDHTRNYIEFLTRSGLLAGVGSVLDIGAGFGAGGA